MGLLEALMPLFFWLPTDAPWVCDTQRWIKAPHFKKSILHSEISADCWVNPTKDNYNELEKQFLFIFTKSPKVKRRYAGPVPVRYQGKQGSYIDVEVNAEMENIRFSIRQDVYLVNSQEHFIAHTYSKDFNGSSYEVSLLKKIDVAIDLIPTVDPDLHILKLRMVSAVSKPFFISESQFKKMLVPKLQSHFLNKTNDLMTIVSQHI